MCRDTDTSIHNWVESVPRMQWNFAQNKNEPNLVGGGGWTYEKLISFDGGTDKKKNILTPTEAFSNKCDPAIFLEYKYFLSTNVTSHCKWVMAIFPKINIFWLCFPSVMTRKAGTEAQNPDRKQNLNTKISKKVQSDRVGTVLFDGGDVETSEKRREKRVNRNLNTSWTWTSKLENA